MSPDEQKAALVAYLRMKVETQDWHAVADAAMDLRELLAVPPPPRGPSLADVLSFLRWEHLRHPDRSLDTIIRAAQAAVLEAP